MEALSIVQIFVNGVACDTDGDTKISLNTRFIDPSKVFSDYASYSYTLSLPKTATNNKIFFSAGVLESRQKFIRDYTCDITVDGASVFQGVFRLAGVTSRFEGNALLPRGYTMDKLFGDDTFNNLSAVEGLVDPEDVLEPGLVARITYFNTAWDEGKDPIIIYPYLLRKLITKTPSLVEDKDTYQDEDGSRLVSEDLKPVYHVCGLLKEIFKQYGYTIDGTAFTDPVFNRLYMFNTQLGMGNANEALRDFGEVKIEGFWYTNNGWKSSGVEEPETQLITNSGRFYTDWTYKDKPVGPRVATSGRKFVNTSYNFKMTQMGEAYNCNLFNSNNLHLELIQDPGGNFTFYEDKEIKKAALFIPQDGVFRIILESELDYDFQDGGYSKVDGDITYIRSDGNKYILDFRNDVYELQLVRNVLLGSLSPEDSAYHPVNTPAGQLPECMQIVTGTFVGDTVTNSGFNVESAAGYYYPEVLNNFSKVFVDGAVNPYLVVGHALGLFDIKHQHGGDNRVLRDLKGIEQPMYQALPWWNLRYINDNTPGTEDAFKANCTLRTIVPKSAPYAGLTGDPPRCVIVSTAHAGLGTEEVDDEHDPEEVDWTPYVLEKTLLDDYGNPMKPQLTVSFSPGEATSAPEGGGTFEEGDSVTVNCKVDEGAKFKEWVDQDGTVMGTTQELTFTMGDISLVLTPNAEAGKMLIISTGPGILTVSGSGSYVEGDAVPVSCTVETGVTMQKWVDSTGAQVAGAVLSFTYTMPNRSETLTPMASGGDKYSVQVSGGNGITGVTINPIQAEYAAGTSVSISCTYQSGLDFKGWKLNGSQYGTSTSFTWSVTQSAIFYAYCEIPSPEIKLKKGVAINRVSAPVVKINIGTGIETVTGGGIQIPGERLTYVAKLKEGYKGFWWSGDYTGSLEELSFRMPNRAVTINVEATSAIIGGKRIPRKIKVPPPNADPDFNLFKVVAALPLGVSEALEFEWDGEAIINGGYARIYVHDTEDFTQSPLGMINMTGSPLTVRYATYGTPVWLYFYVSTAFFDITNLIITKAVDDGGASIATWGVVPGEKEINLTEAPVDTMTAETGGPRGTGLVHVLTKLKKGDILSLCSTVFGAAGMSKRFGWPSHRWNFKLTVEAFRSDPDEYFQFDVKGNTEKEYAWDTDKEDFSKIKSSIWSDFDTSMKVQDLVDNVLKTFNLRLTYRGNNKFSLDTSSVKYGEVVDVTVTNSYAARRVAVPKEYRLEFNTNLEEEGYLQGIEEEDPKWVPVTGAGVKYIDGTEQPYSFKSLFSYTWYKKIHYTAGGMDLELEVPVITAHEPWGDGNYVEQVTQFLEKPTPRFMFATGLYSDTQGITWKYLDQDVPLIEVSNKLGGFELSYSITGQTITDRFFNLLRSADTFTVEVEAYLSGSDYVKLNSGARVQINSDVYYLASIENYDPTRKNLTKLILIKY
jgi:hypothetical protein